MNGDSKLFEIILDDHGSKVLYMENFITEDEAKKLIVEIKNNGNFVHEQLKIYGKIHTSPRTICAFGDPGLTYKYSGTTVGCHAWTPTLNAVRDKIKNIIQNDITFCLANKYKNGDDYIGWHSDDERDLVPNSPIASISLGAERDFQLKKIQPNAPLITKKLEHGSLLLMCGTTQKFYKHQVPKRKKITEERINLTFRNIKNS